MKRIFAIVAMAVVLGLGAVAIPQQAKAATVTGTAPVHYTAKDLAKYKSCMELTVKAKGPIHGHADCVAVAKRLGKQTATFGSGSTMTVKPTFTYEAPHVGAVTQVRPAFSLGIGWAYYL